ncbi:MAG: winged helix-turn-helix transcriptional regulator [Xenococcaceae cyanobacterium MO_188.B32]|nr:winged helix-turn-helix transcriptional regulator [Xenococcaceae cyanobacterium MO_188.B32]
MRNKTYTVTCPDDYKMLAIPVPTKKFKEGYVRTFQSGLLEIASDKELSGNDKAVFLGVLAHLEYENSFTMPITDLAKKLDIQRTHVNSSIKKLVKKGYLIQEGNLGRVNFYMVDPHIAIRCRNSKHNKVINRWEKLPVAK